MCKRCEDKVGVSGLQEGVYEVLVSVVGSSLCRVSEEWILTVPSV